jgi:uncharacterized protein YaaQ
MKMIVVIVNDHETDALIKSMTDAEYRVTRIASTGGFLRSGVATLLLGIDDAQVDKAIGLIRQTTAMMPGEKRGMLFVVPVERYEQV